MNLILLTPSDFQRPDHAVLTGRRLRHVQEILKPEVGQTLTVGLENGRMGKGTITALDGTSVALDVSLEADPPPKIPVTLCCALMRPIVLKRVLLTAASLGVPEIILFHSRQVEKSFWQSTALKDEEIHEQLVLGLEQAKDTVLPKVTLHKRFKPFAEDVLPGLLKGREGIVADPSGKKLEVRRKEVNTPVSSYFLPLTSYVLIIGPEGGFVPYELEKFKDAGCRFVSLGPRILRVETAVVALVSKLT